MSKSKRIKKQRSETAYRRPDSTPSRATLDNTSLINPIDRHLDYTLLQRGWTIFSQDNESDTYDWAPSYPDLAPGVDPERHLDREPTGIIVTLNESHAINYARRHGDPQPESCSYTVTFATPDGRTAGKETYDSCTELLAHIDRIEAYRIAAIAH